MGGTPQPEAWGILPEYWDASGGRRRAGPETVHAVLESMGAGEERPPEERGPLVVRSGETRRLAAPAEIVMETGPSISVQDELPADLPNGYHQLRPLDQSWPIRLIVSPSLCHLPDELMGWGFAVQLHALRSRQSWGLGDLADLRRFARWMARDLEAGMLLLNPLHAPGSGLPQQPSPYFPSSREFRNPLYLRIEDVPGARRLLTRLEPLVRAGRALNRSRSIDRDAVYRLKRQALDELWAAFSGDPRFSRFCDHGGVPLRRFATFCALMERHGPQWRSWPSGLRHPDGPAVEAFASAQARSVDFHRWLQWLIDEQLRRAGGERPLVADLAIGVDPDGADAWTWQSVLAAGMRVGAPPDAFAPAGQDWGLPPFDPWKLRAANYEPYIQILRSVFRHSAGLRVDHVMGLFRLFWIPAGTPASDGLYVRYPARELLDILALESQRAQAFVVGEDLGTVEDEVRQELARRRILSYRLLWFEDRPPSAYPRQALAAVTTHDLPTVAGAWTGSDLRAQRAAGLEPNEAGQEQMVRRLQDVIGLPREAPVEEVIMAAYAALARSPSHLVAATLEDALAVEERPNMPGTTHEWPNWSLALPSTLEEITRDPRVRRLAESLQR